MRQVARGLAGASPLESDAAVQAILGLVVSDDQVTKRWATAALLSVLSQNEKFTDQVGGCSRFSLVCLSSYTPNYLVFYCFCGDNKTVRCHRQSPR